MKSLPISKATESLARYAGKVRKGPLVITSRGKPVAALFSAREPDMESLRLCISPRLFAIIERSWAKYKKEGASTTPEVRRRLSVRKPAR